MAYDLEEGRPPLKSEKGGEIKSFILAKICILGSDVEQPSRRLETTPPKVIPAPFQMSVCWPAKVA